MINSNSRYLIRKSYIHPKNYKDTLKAVIAPGGRMWGMGRAKPGKSTGKIKAHEQKLPIIPARLNKYSLNDTKPRPFLH